MMSQSNTNTPSVSILMASYNRDDLIGGVIKSILEQTYSDFELIVVDDSSTDNTLENLDEINDVRLRVIQHVQNQGIGQVRATGVKHARADYIALADADDHWHHDKLERTIRVLDQYPDVDIVFTDFNNTDHSRGESERAFVQTAEGLEKVAKIPLESGIIKCGEGVAEGTMVANFIGAPTVCFRKNVINQIGSFNEKLARASDFEFFFRAAIRGRRFAYIDAPLLNRNITPDSVTQNVITFHNAYMDCLKECQKWVQNCRQWDSLFDAKYASSHNAQLRTHVIERHPLPAFRSLFLALRHKGGWRSIRLISGLLMPAWLLRKIIK